MQNFANLKALVKLFQQNFKKTAISEKFDPQNISAIVWYNSSTVYLYTCDNLLLTRVIVYLYINGMSFAHVMVNFYTCDSLTFTHVIVCAYTCDSA